MLQATRVGPGVEEHVNNQKKGFNRYSKFQEQGQVSEMRTGLRALNFWTVAWAHKNTHYEVNEPWHVALSNWNLRP